jgi:DNA-binding response OmpR family regulator
MKVLVVEDELELAASICEYLGEKSFTCETAHDYYSAVEKIEEQEYACIILDITLPNGNGLDVLKQLKLAGKAEGVLIISARSSVDDKVRGLQKGADDYLAKPFHLSELSARLSAILRRKAYDGGEVLRVDELVMNTASRTTEFNDNDIPLTPKEYDLLLYFLSNKNKVITKEALAEHLYGDGMGIPGDYDFLYSHVKNLRKKLQKAGAPDYIKAVYGMGYKFSTKVQ